MSLSSWVDNGNLTASDAEESDNDGSGGKTSPATTSTSDTPSVFPQCSCWDSAVGNGPTCIEYTNNITCNGNGNVLPTGQCVCDNPAVGQGPSCSEYSNAKTCSNAGTAQQDGSCVCWSSALGLGPSCSEYTDSTSYFEIHNTNILLFNL